MSMNDTNFSVLNMMLQRQIEFEERIKEIQSRNIADLKILLDDHFSKTQTLLASQAVEIDSKLAEILNHISEFSTKDANKEEHISDIHTSKDPKSSQIKNAEQAASARPTAGGASLKTCTPIKSDLLKIESTVIADLVMNEEVQVHEKKRVDMISNVVNRMNQSDQKNSKRDLLQAESEQVEDWTLDTGFDRNSETITSWSGFVHFVFGISGPNTLTGHKGSRSIHPKSPFVTGHATYENKRIMYLTYPILAKWV